jgi:methyl-accepting chemotaxis protein
MAAVAQEAEVIAKHVLDAVEELSAQIGQVSKGASVQQDRATSTATAMEEMNSTVLEVAKSAALAATHADETKIKAQEGHNVVDKAVQAISHVSAVSATLKDKMAILGEQAKSIDRIMNVISDIADQTNLLALNAAIEAARAGDAGRGFAVVADEVRKLAEKTMLATHEVGDSIKSIQAGAASNLSSVDDAVTAVEKATGLARQSGLALKDIVGQIDAESDLVRTIAAASEEQSATSNEINHAVEDVAKISAESSLGMGNAAKSVLGLAEQAKKLEALISTIQS